jgi:hypothetical protein
MEGPKVFFSSATGRVIRFATEFRDPLRGLQLIKSRSGDFHLLFNSSCRSNGHSDLKSSKMVANAEMDIDLEVVDEIGDIEARDSSVSTAP